MKYETAGDPMTGLEWTRKTTEKIADALKILNIDVSANTVGRLLKNMDFALRVNHKKLSSGSKTEQAERDEQFTYISKVREKFARAGQPVVSVDTKRKELVGNFKNPGTAWSQKPRLTKDHDFRSEAVAIVSPYSIYDPVANRGSVFVGTSSDTAEFAVESIETWWREEGIRAYPKAKRLLILADGGGSNGFRNRAWKANLQEKMCDAHGLAVTVCHYPTGASKWNPVEHRLHSEITKNWSGHPLESLKTVVNYISTTTTKAGLRVSARLVGKTYQTGVKVSEAEMMALSLHPHAIQPKRNYSLRPR